MTPNPHRFLVAINSTEWLNLISRGDIRLARRRVVTTGSDPAAKELMRMFALAPYTKLESTVDLFVLELSSDWGIASSRHPLASNEVAILDLSSVQAHHPIAEREYEYYAAIAARVGVELGRAVFEKTWGQWVLNETLEASIRAATALQRCLGIPISAGTKRSDRYSWTEVAQLVLRPHDLIKSKPAPIESLFRGLAEIADSVAGTRENQQFHLACTLEWIDLRLNRDPLKKRADRERVQAFLAEAKSQPLLPVSEQCISEIAALVTAFPRAFTEELTPQSIASIVQLLSDARSRRLKVETLLSAVERVGRSSPGATLITFALATYLGPELTNQLIRAMSQVAPLEIDWTPVAN